MKAIVTSTKWKEYVIVIEESEMLERGKLVFYTNAILKSGKGKR